jgi:hypothetical protein
MKIGVGTWGSVRGTSGTLALALLTACGAQVDHDGVTGDEPVATESVGSVGLALTDYSATINAVSGSSLYSVNAATGAATLLGTSQGAVTTAFTSDQAGTAYAISNQLLYRIDLSTSAVSQIGTQNWGSGKVLAYGKDQNVYKLFSVDTAGHLVAIDLSTGVTSDRGPGYGTATTLAYTGGWLFTVIGNTLLKIDPHTGAQTRIANPGEFDANTILTADGAPFHLYSYQPRFGTYQIEPYGHTYPIDTSPNLLQQPIAFDNAVWVRNRSTIVVNGAIAPDGTTHGEILKENTTTGTHSIQQSFSVAHGTPVTFSVFVKPAGRRYVDVDLISLVNTANAVGITADISAGKILRKTSSGQSLYIDSHIEILTMGEWHRISLTAVPDYVNDSVRAVVYMMPDPNTSSYTGNGTSGVNLWGGQVSLAKDTAAQDAIEEYDRTYVNGWPQEHATVTLPSNIPDPSGLTNALLMKEDNQTGVHRLYQTNLPGTTERNYTWSIDVKAPAGSARNTVETKLSSPDDPNSYIGVRAYVGAGTPGVVNQANAGLGINTSSEVRALGNDWYRISVTGRPTTVRSNRLAVELRLAQYVFGPTTYAGDGVSTLYVWGPQLQANLDPAASSPITAFVDTPRDCPDPANPIVGYQCLDTLYALRQNGQLSRFVGLHWSGSAYGNDILSGSTWPAGTLLAP